MPSSTLLFRLLLPAGIVCLLVCATANNCVAQNQRPLCTLGNNGFQANFRSGVAVTVESEKNESLSVRACSATLDWETQKLDVSPQAAQIDLDLFGADLKAYGPVAAFQIKKAANDCCDSYQIYSLEKPPRLLRTITGGSSFAAWDKDFDGRIEIWTDDSAAVNGLDGLLATEMDHPPAYALRFEKNKLIDVNSEHLDYFDEIVRRVREEIAPDSLHEFKLSDGILGAGYSLDPVRTRRLRAVKIQALEIVWAYLYSGREQQAWSSLAEMWPPGDVDRIRMALTNARSNGMLAQTDGISRSGPPAKKKSQYIYKQSEVTPAQAIYLWRFPPQGQVDYTALETEVSIDLVIDSAGKVASAVPTGGEGIADAGLMDAAKEWKFIPGMRNGHSVASRLRLYTSLRR